MSDYQFYFIHNYKTLGTTIYSQLPRKYKDIYYGHTTIKNIIDKNPELKLKPDMNINEKVSVDHIHVDRLINMGFFNKLKKISFMMIVRDPIDRFISICNFHNVSINESIHRLKHKIGDPFHQHRLYENNNNLKIKLYKMTSKQKIINFFKQFDINIDLSIKKNVSKKTWNRSQIKPNQINFLKRFYKKDYKLFNLAE